MNWRIYFHGIIKEHEKCEDTIIRIFFTINTNTTNIDAEKAYVFHTTISKGLFLHKREIPDIQPTVLFLCTIVKGPDKEGWKKF